MAVGGFRICKIHFDELRPDGTCRKCTIAAAAQKEREDRPHRRLKGIAGAPARPWRKRRL